MNMIFKLNYLRAWVNQTFVTKLVQNIMFMVCIFYFTDTENIKASIFTLRSNASPLQFYDAEHWPVSGNPARVSASRTGAYDPVKTMKTKNFVTEWIKGLKCPAVPQDEVDPYTPSPSAAAPLCPSCSSIVWISQSPPSSVSSAAYAASSWTVRKCYCA